MDWPKIYYVHAEATDEPDSVREYMLEDGLPEWYVDKHIENFRRIGYEVRLTVECYEDGSYKVIKVEEL